MTADRFNEISSKMGLTRKQLATDLGVSAGSIGQWSRGDKPIPEDIAKTMEGNDQPLMCTQEDGKACLGCGDCIPW